MYEYEYLLLPNVIAYRRALDVFSTVSLFVCQRDNLWMSKHRMMKLGVGALYKDLGRVRIWGL